MWWVDHKVLRQASQCFDPNLVALWQKQVERFFKRSVLIFLPRGVLTNAEARRLIETTPAVKPRDMRDRAIRETLYAKGVRRAKILFLNELETCFDPNNLFRFIPPRMMMNLDGEQISEWSTPIADLESFLLH